MQTSGGRRAVRAKVSGGAACTQHIQGTTSRLAWLELSDSEGEEERWGPKGRQRASQLPWAWWAQVQALHFLYYRALLRSSTSPVTTTGLRTFTLSEIRIVHGHLTNILGIRFSLLNNAAVATQHSKIL